MDKNKSAFERTEIMLGNQASAFNGACNIYAPEYRQATYYSFFDKDKNGRRWVIYKNETDALAALTSAYARLKSGNGYYKQGFISTLFASSDQGWSSYLYKEFKTGVVTSSNQNINNLKLNGFFAYTEASALPV